jgi:hypothetical protein
MLRCRAEGRDGLVGVPVPAPRRPWQLTHHTGKRAFDWLLDFAKDARSHSVRVNGRPLEASGAILIWGATRRPAVML